MRLLCTHPGKLGDLLWALPTIRALARKVEAPVDLLLPQGMFDSAFYLLQQQRYIGKVYAMPSWEIRDTAPATPWEPPAWLGTPGLWNTVLHLGYRKWPEDQLPFFTFDQAAQQWDNLRRLSGLPEDKNLYREDLRLDEPWIQVKERHPYTTVAVGFSDEWLELKMGLLLSVLSSGAAGLYTILGKHQSRLMKEYQNLSFVPGIYDLQSYSMVEAAAAIQKSEVFLGCLSSLAVLAAAIGKPRVLVEPNPHRHHPIFQHWDTPLVSGSDGLPTFDARHVADAIRKKLAK